ncbi:hypothetical protein A0H81_12782 [Grifola frondosa]|uniref:F-box domain-containing protein n=1 Tax=Grifola frondosa TaxID=5627 RepID=A0A1C7LR82_GRIFR|nr:hypothetical protein A0H81_12782 [Grifola frondosa]
MLDAFNQLTRTAKLSHSARLQPTCTSLSSLPADILLEVAVHLSTLCEILHFGLTSTKVYSKVVPALYAFVELQGASQCERTLGMLQRCPEVARHVQRLAVHPEKFPALSGYDSARVWDNAGMVSRLVSKAARHLDALRVFEWDGEDMLPDDRMWSHLHNWCPNLRCIGTTFGCFLPRPSSYLFKFSDLIAFSLTFKDGFYAQQLHVLSRESEPVFSQLWNMLAQRCPHLESLSIVGNSSEPSDGTHLYAARWPRLRKLALGALIFDTSVAGQPPPMQSFLEFLRCHPTLETFHVLNRANTSLDLSVLEPSALPLLKEFSGSFNHLKMLVDRGHNAAAVGGNAGVGVSTSPTLLSTSLRHICFPHPMHLRDLTPLAISRVLMNLHALTSIKIAFAVQSGYDSNGVFRTIIASCPHLLHLDITCACRPSFFFESFSRSLRSLSRLRTLSLTMVKMPGDEPMHAGAARIALANPRLTRFTITFIPANTYATPPLPRSSRACLSSGRGPVSTRDEHLRARGHELGGRLWDGDAFGWADTRAGLDTALGVRAAAEWPPRCREEGVDGSADGAEPCWRRGAPDWDLSVFVHLNLVGGLWEDWGLVKCHWICREREQGNFGTGCRVCGANLHFVPYGQSQTV